MLPSIKHLIPFALTAFSLLSGPAVSAEKVEKTYEINCASCHGKNLEGGLGGSLIDGNSKHGSSEAEIAHIIKAGLPTYGMPNFADGLSDEQIRALVVYIREKSAEVQPQVGTSLSVANEEVFKTKHHDFTLEKVIDGFDVLWALDFMADGSILATEKKGKLWHIVNGTRSEVSGIPDVWANGQGGLLDIAVHQDNPTNPWIYLSLSQPEGKKSMTKVIRGKLRDKKLVQQQTIFEVPESYFIKSNVHFGSRIVLDKGYIYFSFGDRGQQNMAQKIDVPNGKIHRLHDDGRIPTDNPFVATEGAYTSIWSYGNRNPQGLTMSADGLLWETEHGPRGGDEVNIIEKGINYGWPEITYGINYNGTAITDQTHHPEMAQPMHYWVPSIAVTAIDEYKGIGFPQWENNLVVGSLAKQEVQRIVVKNGKVTETELMMKNQGRVRDLVVGPDGMIYLAITTGSPKVGSIYRMTPTE